MFEQLYGSAQRDELLLVEGGMARFHLRKDNSLVIYEIISIRPGAGSEMLRCLKQTPNATCIIAKCPADLESNAWYRKRGFVLVEEETTRTGRKLNVWNLDLNT